MKNNKLLELIKTNNIVIPVYIYKLLPRLDIDLETFVFLMYLNNYGEKIIFDPQKMSNDLGINIEKIFNYVDTLVKKKLAKFEIIKNDKNVSEEYLSIEYFYEKVDLLLIEENENTRQDNSSDSDIFGIIEKEFGRTLSSIEYEIIKSWRETYNNDELILEALKEAVLNGVANLRYIDRILAEWNKKGIRTKVDVEKNRRNYKAKNEKVEIFEYNWLDDEE